ncbi:MAG: hypothetical protein ACI8WT_003309, partial [Clostridium sp.]
QIIKFVYYIYSTLMTQNPFCQQKNIPIKNWDI